MVLTKINAVTGSDCPKIRQRANYHTCDYRASHIYRIRPLYSVFVDPKKFKTDNFMQEKKMREWLLRIFFE